MPLRLQATEDDVYHLMDLKEQYFIMTAICSMAEGISAYFFIYQKRCWDLAYLCTALALAIILLLRQAIKISRRIMEAENCYMALEEDSLASASRKETENMSPAGSFTMRWIRS